MTKRIINKKELLLEDWKQCMENIRFFRDQVNKMSLWEFGLFPAIGIGIAVVLFREGNMLYSGITIIILSIILGFIDNITKDESHRL